MPLTQAQTKVAARIRWLVNQVDEKDRMELETTINLVFLIANKAAGNAPAHTNKLRFIADECGRVDRADDTQVKNLLSLIRLIIGT